MCLFTYPFLFFPCKFSNKNKTQPTSSTAATSSGDVQEAEASSDVEDVRLDRDAEEDEEDNECEIMDKEDKRSLMDNGGKDVPDIEDVEEGDEEVPFSFKNLGYQAKMTSEDMAKAKDKATADRAKAKDKEKADKHAQLQAILQQANQMKREQQFAQAGDLYNQGLIQSTSANWSRNFIIGKFHCLHAIAYKNNQDLSVDVLLEYHDLLIAAVPELLRSKTDLACCECLLSIQYHLLENNTITPTSSNVIYETIEGCTRQITKFDKGKAEKHIRLLPMAQELHNNNLCRPCSHSDSTKSWFVLGDGRCFPRSIIHQLTSRGLTVQFDGLVSDPSTNYRVDNSLATRALLGASLLAYAKANLRYVKKIDKQLRNAPIIEDEDGEDGETYTLLSQAEHLVQLYTGALKDNSLLDDIIDSNLWANDAILRGAAEYHQTHIEVKRTNQQGQLDFGEIYRENPTPNVWLSNTTDKNGGGWHFDLQGHSDSELNPDVSKYYVHPDKLILEPLPELSDAHDGEVIVEDVDMNDATQDELNVDEPTVEISSGEHKTRAIRLFQKGIEMYNEDKAIEALDSFKEALALVQGQEDDAIRMACALRQNIVTCIRALATYEDRGLDQVDRDESFCLLLNAVRDASSEEQRVKYHIQLAELSLENLNDPNVSIPDLVSSNMHLNECANNVLQSNLQDIDDYKSLCTKYVAEASAVVMPWKLRGVNFDIQSNEDVDSAGGEDVWSASAIPFVKRTRKYGEQSFLYNSYLFTAPLIATCKKLLQEGNLNNNARAATIDLYNIYKKVEDSGMDAEVFKTKFNDAFAKWEAAMNLTKSYKGRTNSSEPLSPLTEVGVILNWALQIPLLIQSTMGPTILMRVMGVLQLQSYQFQVLCIVKLVEIVLMQT